MNLIATVHSQFHRPAGLLGRVVGWIMANRRSNIQRSCWTIDPLNLHGGDHVLEIGFGPGLGIEQAARLVPGSVLWASITPRSSAGRPQKSVRH
jgi:hypothetical protein